MSSANEASRALPRVVLLGLPNSGKSALFNALVGRSVALVYDRPGVTRDCRVEAVSLNGAPAFTLVDTPGLLPEFVGEVRRKGATKNPTRRANSAAGAKTLTLEELDALMAQRTLEELQNADIVLFLFDGKQANQAESIAFFNRARALGKPLIPVVNKSDAFRKGQFSPDLYTLGHDLWCVSAIHRRGLAELLAHIDKLLKPGQSSKPAQKNALGSEKDEKNALTPKEGEIVPADGIDASASKETAEGDDVSEESPLRVAIVGRPNVGKSTLVNALLRRNQQLVANYPGVTRDSVELAWTYQGRQFLLCDTAGVRRKARIHDHLEKITVGSTLRHARQTDVCILVLDAVEIEASEFGELLQQDLLLADAFLKEGRCVVLALNKWDRVRDKAALLKKIAHSLQFAAHLKDVFWTPISAEKKKGLNDLLETVLLAEQAWKTSLPTGKLNAWLRELTAAYPPPTSGLRPPKLKYITQVGTAPPQFVVFGTRTDHLPETYQRFVQNHLQDDFQLRGVPLRIQWRKQDNPYAPKTEQKRRTRTVPTRRP